MLTDAAAKQAKPKEKDYKINDSAGLLLFVAKTGRKTWRFKYIRDGKEHRLMLGAMPEMRLSEARSLRDKAKLVLRDGRNPKHELARIKATNRELADATFEKYAREWWEVQKPRWKDVHANDVITSLERDVFSEIGDFPIHEITAPLLLPVLQKVENRGAIETAMRLRQRAERIFKYAKAKGAPVVSNPAADVKEAMKPAKKKRKWPAFSKIEDARELVRNVELSHCLPITRLASRFLALVAQRPGMVYGMRWDNLHGIDWNKSPDQSADATWVIPSEDMKMDFDRRGEDEWDHAVPLAAQSVEILQAVRPLTGNGPYVFPNGRDMLAPMSDNALSSLYRRLGYKGKHVPHGWRACFSTIMNERSIAHGGGDERLALDRLVIDLMLAHIPDAASSDEFAYNRAKFMDRRRELAQTWADLLI